MGTFLYLKCRQFCGHIFSLNTVHVYFTAGTTINTFFSSVGVKYVLLLEKFDNDSVLVCKPERKRKVYNQILDLPSLTPERFKAPRLAGKFSVNIKQRLPKFKFHFALSA